MGAASSTRQPHAQSLTDIEGGASPRPSVELSLFYQGGGTSLLKARNCLERLLDSGGTELVHLQHWLVERHAEELLHFLVAARESTAQDPDFSRRSEFQSLHDEFIRAGAPQELNISASARRCAAEAFNRNPDDWNTVPGVASEHLSPVMLEVTDLIIKAHWFGFVKQRIVQGGTI